MNRKLLSDYPSGYVKGKQFCNLDENNLQFQLMRYPFRSFQVFLLFLAFVVARYIQIGARRDILATMRFEFLLGIVVVALVSYQLGSRKPEIGKSSAIIFSIGLLFLAMILQIPFAADPVMAQMIFLDRVVKFAILTYLMIVMIESPRYLRFFLFAFLFSIFYITLESVRGLITGGLVWQNQGILRLHGAVPIYTHPNSLGGVAMGTLPFVVFLFPVIKSNWIKVGLLGLAATSLICVIYSGSRTAYVGLVAFILWWWFQSRKKWKFLGYGLVIGFVAILCLPDQYIERFQSIGGEEKEGHSKEARKVILNDAVQIFAENPLGVGIASFPAVRLEKFGRFQDTHNLYLEVGTNLGIQGLIIFLALIYFMMKELRRVTFDFRTQRKMLRRTQLMPQNNKKMINRYYSQDHDLRFLIATAQATGGFIFIRLVLGMFGMDLYEVYWWYGAGVAIVLAGLVDRSKKITQQLVLLARDADPNERLE